MFSIFFATVIVAISLLGPGCKGGREPGAAVPLPFVNGHPTYLREDISDLRKDRIVDPARYSDGEWVEHIRNKFFEGLVYTVGNGRVDSIYESSNLVEKSTVDSALRIMEHSFGVTSRMAKGAHGYIRVWKLSATDFAYVEVTHLTNAGDQVQDEGYMLVFYLGPFPQAEWDSLAPWSKPVI